VYRQYIVQDAALSQKPGFFRKTRFLTSIHNVLIAEDALEAAVQLSAGWLPERHLPDKALDLLSPFGL